MSDTPTMPAHPWWTRAIPFAAFGVFLLLAVMLVLTKPYPSAFDELEHVAYVVFLKTTHEWRPMFEAMRDLPVDSLTRWADRPNYLGHPSPYYWYETLALDRALPLRWAIVLLRLASAALVAVGIALSLRAGWRAFRRDWLALAAFCALVALCPKLLAVTGQVTNDALALLAGGLAYWAALTEERRPWIGRIGLALALALALWAKPNAALAVGAVLGLFALLRLRERRTLGPMAALVAGGLVGLVPTALIVAKYRTLVPVTVEQFGGVHQVPGLLDYLPAYLVTVAYTFCFGQTGTWPLAGIPAMVAVFIVWALLAAVVAGGALAASGPHGANARLVAIAAPLALLLVLPIHFWFSATQLGGSLPAASFRYYLPIWPFLAHAVAAGIATGTLAVRVILTGIAVAALAIGWLSP